MIKINLLRQPERKKINLGGVQTKLIGAALAGIALIALGTFYWYWSLSDTVQAQGVEIRRLNQESARLKNVQAQMARFERQKSELDRRLSVVRRLQNNRRGPVRLLSSLVTSIPDSPTLWLSSLEQKGQTLSIEGRSFDVASLASFIDNLSKQRPTIKNVELDFWERDGQTIKFKLSCQVENK